MTNKFGITGCHGSGKTFLAKKLQKRALQSGKTVYLVSEVARNCPYELGTIDAQDYIFHNQMERERYAMRQDVDTIICDRTVMDNLCYYYAVLYDNVGKHDDGAPWKRWDILYEQAKSLMPIYDIIVRMPLNLEYLNSDDPIRPKSLEYAIRIDRLFDIFVDKWVTNRKWV